MGVFVALVVGTGVAGLTVACLFGTVEYELSPHQMRGGQVARVKSLGGLGTIWPGEVRLEVFEDGRQLGPRVEDLPAVRGAGEGAYAFVPVDSAAEDAGTLHFSASDGSSPRLNGRRYLVRFPRRSLPAAAVLVMVSWGVLVWVLVRWWRGLPRSPTLGVAGWSVIVSGGVYSLFVVQAGLPRASVPWLLAVVAVALAPFLARFVPRPSALPEWFPWLAGYLGWAASSSLVASSYASPGVAVVFLAVSAGGLAAYLGLRAALDGQEHRAQPLVVGLFIFGASLSLARDAGFDLWAGLAALDPGSAWSGGLVNPWTTKFVGHWILVLGCIAGAALGRAGRGSGRGAALVGILAIVTIAVNGSKSALVSLLLSLFATAVAWRWPVGARRVALSGLVGTALLAPLLAGVAWRTQSQAAGKVSEEVQVVLDLDHRGGKWEFSRRLIVLRPLRGWGFGASGTLPGRHLPVDEALDLDSGAGSLPSGYPALAGGHPHNAALLTWLDLGLVGALLLAGLLWAIGRSIAAVEEQRGTHAALLGLLTVTATYLGFNYPAWEPEVMSILWMTAVLAAAVLPEPAVPRRTLLRSGAAVLLVLALGGSIVVWDRADRWWTAREVRGGETVLDADAGRLVVGGEARRLQYDGTLDAGAEFLHWEPEGTALMRGWAYGPPGAGAPDAVLVFVGSELADVVWPELPSPEAFARSESRDVRALVSGFLLRLQPDRLDLEEPVTVVALRPEGAVAAELPPLAAAPPERSQVP